MSTKQVHGRRWPPWRAVPVAQHTRLVLPPGSTPLTVSVTRFLLRLPARSLLLTTLVLLRLATD